MVNSKKLKLTWVKVCTVLALVFCCVGLAFADDSLGNVAKTVTGSFKDMGKMMVGIAYLGGFGFAIAAIFKFKQHKDNPTQIPLGTPIALLVIGIALIFLPGLIKVGGGTAGLKDAGGFGGEGAEKIAGSGS
jgi:intracellular multiplication protein IcmD